MHSSPREKKIVLPISYKTTCDPPSHPYPPPRVTKLGPEWAVWISSRWPIYGCWKKLRSLVKSFGLRKNLTGNLLTWKIIWFESCAPPSCGSVAAPEQNSPPSRRVAMVIRAPLSHIITIHVDKFRASFFSTKGFLYKIYA